jgi:hypothetical protein
MRTAAVEGLQAHGVLWFWEMRKACPAILAVALTMSACGTSQRTSVAPSSPGTVDLPGTQNAIGRVLTSNEARGGFPRWHRAGLVGCAFGGGPVALRIKGICGAQVSFTSGRTAIVTFTEFWPGLIRGPGLPTGWLQHWWSFELQSPGHTKEAWWSARIHPLGDYGASLPDFR